MNWWQQVWKSSYVRMLEEENARLRAENRAFLNSLLGTVGFPPVEFPADAKPLEVPRVRKRSWPQLLRIKEAKGSG
ncbi:MAG TPA: hypothetical protein VMU53_11965 [Candidatus Sulfotelmatobacter sp.]|nr:hypothetical protein [Candidatus Sulfotelmatobacter sp.]